MNTMMEITRLGGGGGKLSFPPIEINQNREYAMRDLDQKASILHQQKSEARKINKDLLCRNRRRESKRTTAMSINKSNNERGRWPSASAV